jgi:hypothetical protein
VAFEERGPGLPEVRVPLDPLRNAPRHALVLPAPGPWALIDTRRSHAAGLTRAHYGNLVSYPGYHQEEWQGGTYNSWIGIHTVREC